MTTTFAGFPAPSPASPASPAAPSPAGSPAVGPSPGTPLNAELAQGLAESLNRQLTAGVAVGQNGVAVDDPELVRRLLAAFPAVPFLAIRVNPEALQRTPPQFRPEDFSVADLGISAKGTQQAAEPETKAGIQKILDSLEPLGIVKIGTFRDAFNNTEYTVDVIGSIVDSDAGGGVTIFPGKTGYVFYRTRADELLDASTPFFSIPRFSVFIAGSEALTFFRAAPGSQINTGQLLAGGELTNGASVALHEQVHTILRRANLSSFDDKPDRNVQQVESLLGERTKLELSRSQPDNLPGAVRRYSQSLATTLAIPRGDEVVDVLDLKRASGLQLLVPPTANPNATITVQVVLSPAQAEDVAIQLRDAGDRRQLLAVRTDSSGTGTLALPVGPPGVLQLEAFALGQKATQNVTIQALLPTDREVVSVVRGLTGLEALNNAQEAYGFVGPPLLTRIRIEGDRLTLNTSDATGTLNADGSFALQGRQRISNFAQSPTGGIFNAPVDFEGVLDRDNGRGFCDFTLTTQNNLKVRARIHFAPSFDLLSRFTLRVASGEVRGSCQFTFADSGSTVSQEYRLTVGGQGYGVLSLNGFAYDFAINPDGSLFGVTSPTTNRISVKGILSSDGSGTFTLTDLNDGQVSGTAVLPVVP